MQIGDLVIALSAAPADSTALHYIGNEPHAPTADFELIHAAVHAAKEQGKRARIGPIVSSDIFYNPDGGQYQRWSDRGILAVEMEGAVLFTLGALRKIQTACLLIVSDVVVEGEFVRISDEEMKRGGRPDDRARARRGHLREALSAADTVFLVNPASDNGATGKRWPELAHRAAQLGLEGETRFSERPGHLMELAREAADGGAELVVAVGGDGTMNETVNGLLRAGRSAALATLPIGTGMDFVRTYGIPKRFEDAVRVAVDGRTREIDAVRVRYRDLGRRRGRALLRERRQRRHERRSRAARERHVEGARRQGDVLLRARPGVRDVAELGGARSSWEDGTRAGPMHDVVVANGQWHGGGMWLAPKAEPDDGLLDVAADRRHHAADFARTAPKIYRGTHLTHPKVDLVQARRGSRSRRTSRCPSSSTASSPGRRPCASRSSRAHFACACRPRSRGLRPSCSAAQGRRAYRSPCRAAAPAR